MKPACARHDQDILMLVHGEIESRRALLVRAHLALCPACRERRRRLEGVTRSLAAVLANPRLGMRRLAPSRALWASVGLLVALFAVLGLLVSSEIAVAGGAAAVPAPPAPASAKPPDHCEGR